MRITSSLTAGTATLAQYTYSTDPAGNITAIADGTNAGYSRTFGYDDLHRLITANTGGALWGSGAFTWDAMGNMLSATLGAVHRTFSHQGSTPKIDTATGLAGSMTYDAAGNELKSPVGNPGDGSPAALYSPRNLLVAQFVREYDRCYEEYGSACIQPDIVQVWRSNLYDGRGVRVVSAETIVSQTIGGDDSAPEPTLYFYTPELAMLNLIAPSTGRTADVIWFASRPIADHDATTVRYTFTDHLGTPILQTSPTAAIVWRAEYEPFGNLHILRAGTTPDDQPLRLPGQQVAYTTAAGEESYNVFRWYRSGWGRYTQSDPMEWAGQEFTYASDNPIRNTDALGLFDTGSAAKDVIKNAINACGEKTESVWGGPVIGAILMLLQADDANPEEFESQIKKCNKCKKNCKPCIPPVGTLAYREDTSPTSSPHVGVPPPHWHLYRMNQNPYNCQCFWVPVPDNKGGLGASPPPPGTVPITPAAGGGEW